MRLPLNPIAGALAAVAIAATAAAAQQPGASPSTATPANARAATAAADTSYRAPGMVRGTGPNGATMRCRDGSYPAANAPDTACDSKGGVLVKFPLERVPGPPRGRPARSSLSAPAEVAAEEPVPASRAKTVVTTPDPPRDATLLCGDGTFVTADTTAARCNGKGGVKLRIRQPRRP